MGKADKLSLQPKEKKAVDVNVETDYCDKYNYYVEIKSEKNNIDSHFQGYDFAILKTDPNKIKNEEYYYATHIQRGPWWSNYAQDLEKAVDVLDKSNIGGVRSSLLVTDCIKSSESGNDVVWPERYTELFNLYKKHGIKLIAVVDGTRNDRIPTTDESGRNGKTLLTL